MAKIKHHYCALILAAGQSKRFKSNKLAVRFKDKLLIERTLEPFFKLQYQIRSIFVVTGAYSNELQPILNHLQVKQIHNEFYASGGMSSSIKIGVKQISNNIENFNGLFIHPGDIPFISGEDLILMINALENSQKKIIIPTHDKKRGHPLLVHSSLMDKLLDLEEHRKGLKGFLTDFKDAIEFVNSRNPGILYDIDSPDDLEKILKES
ncbi:MAG: NTP transferase domain-containing protein [Candidatus Hodarchaeota archaeon]